MGRRLSVYRTFCGKISKRSKGGSLVPTWAIGQKIPSFCRWGSPFDQRRAFVCDERGNSQLITICMLIGALAIIGLVLTGTLQMRVSQSPVAVLTR